MHTARASGYRVNIASLSLPLSSAYPTHRLPTGYSDVVGSTREDVYETVAAIIADVCNWNEVLMGRREMKLNGYRSTF